MKKEKKEKKNKKEESSEMSALTEQMTAVIGGLNSVAGAVAKLVELQTADKNPAIVSVSNAGISPSNVSPTRTFDPKMDDETYPNKYIPPKYRQLVNEILSSEFGLDITDFDDRTDFQIHIIVPEKYSSVTPEDRKKGIQDIRSRMIPRSLGENGVREWCNLVRQNLNKYYTREGVASPFSNNQ